MKIHEVLDRDPRSLALANTGQARISDKQDERAMAELRAELETFVCDGQYGEAIDKILRTYLTRINQPSQIAAWVSGFYGSGKSHLLKMLAHLWVDTPFPDGATARSLVRGLSKDVQASLRELDTAARRSQVPAVAAAGTLPAGRSDDVRLTVLAIVLRAVGLPENYPQAQFIFWLREQGFLDRVRASVEAAGRDWLKELSNLYVSPVIARAVLQCDSNFAVDEKQARQTLRAQFPDRASDISTGEFLAAVRAALAPNSQLPHTILVLDEVQQYIGDDGSRATTITDLAEAIAKNCDSRILLVASGQSALSSTPQLQKLRDRFVVTVQLSDTDVEAVTRKVLLQKKPTGLAAVAAVLDRNAGEVSKHLHATKLQERPEDKKTRDQDYPLLPTRRRFWEEAFRAVDKAGNHSQLRSQLRILHDALQRVADAPVGTVLSADVLFDSVAADMVNSGVLPNELNNRIRGLADGTPRGRLRQQLCGLIFLINKLPREAAIDTGVRANARTLADLLVSNIDDDSGPFRQQVEAELKDLANSSVLMLVQDEFFLQTSEGAEWESAFREKANALLQREAELHRLRDQALATAVQAEVQRISLRQGQAKEKRVLALYARHDEPPPQSDEVTVWLRDGWAIAFKEVENEARRRGHEDAVVHVHLPKKGDDVLRKRIAEVEAAKQLLAEKGVPSSSPGLQARESMLSRQKSAEQGLAAEVQGLLGAARVVQGGGNEVHGESLAKKLAIAADASVARLFPRFPDADADLRNWGVAVRRARDGADQPFLPVGWERAVDDHPVGREILSRIGTGKRGTDLRRELKAPPFGWPQDAIDAALLSLHRSGTLRATLNGQVVAQGQLDQTKIQSAEFRTERVKLGTEDKIKLRGLFQKLSIPCKSGEEELRAPQFLEALLTLAATAGGEAPLPAAPDTRKIQDLKGTAGSDQLAGILAMLAELESSIVQWQVLQKRAAQRQPGWQLLSELLRHAEGLPVAAQLAPEVEAICQQRSLLADADPLSQLLSKVVAALRAAVTDQHKAYQVAHAEGQAVLASDASWGKLPAPDRAALQQQHGLVVPVAPAFKSEADLLAELDRQSLAGRASAVAAVPERVRQVMAEAARKLAPKAKRLSLRTATLVTTEQVQAWIAEHQKLLLDAVQQGPVIVG
jgi:hypothetical protein